jgi:hypothetical protein
MQGQALKTASRAARLAFAGAVAVLAFAASGGAGRADDPPSCASSAEAAYSLALTALTGPQGADATLAVSPAAGCAPVDTLKKVQLKTFTSGGKLDDVRNLNDVAAPHGVANVELGQLERGRRIEAQVLVQADAKGRTYVVQAEAAARLRPDLVAAVHAPPQTLTTRPVDVVVDVRELNGDTPAAAMVSLAWGPTVFASKEVTVPAGGSLSVPFPGISLTTPVTVELSAVVSNVAPAETDATNNEAKATVDVTENELATARLVLPSFGGYGAQFNGHLYAPITPKPPNGYGDLEGKVAALEPQLVRIFYNDNWEANADRTHPEFQQNYDSFVNVVELAQEAGATVDISFQSLSAATRTNPGPAMAKFADVLKDLVRNHGLTNVRWAEVGNEPNDPNGAVTLEQYNTLYRALDAELVARGLRDQIHLMGGGLVENPGPKSHYIWLKWIAQNMGDVVDAYAEHVYWWYDKPGRLEFRLRDIRRLVTEELPESQRKPMYLMEFGIRGYPSCDSKPVFANRYYLPDCTEMWRTNIAAFQQLWFTIHTAQLGFSGAAKWDAYQAVYDRTSVNAQIHWMIGPGSEGFPLFPTYYAMYLLFHTMEPGWNVIGVDPWESNDWSAPSTPGGETADDQPEKEMTAFASPGGELTLIGLDTHGKSLNTVSTEPAPEYSIGGLPADRTFNLALWNATGDGTNSVAGTVTTNAAGVARFHVPLQAAFALTTVPVS